MKERMRNKEEKKKKKSDNVSGVESTDSPVCHEEKVQKLHHRETFGEVGTGSWTAPMG